MNYYYNWDGKLKDVNNGSGNRLVSLKYDPMGNRVQKSTSAQGTRKYIIDIAGELPTKNRERKTGDSYLLLLDISGLIIYIS